MTRPTTQPEKKNVQAVGRRLRSLEFFQKNKALFDKERQMRMLRSARSQADQMENYLADLEAKQRYMASHREGYQQAADYQQRVEEFKKQVDAAFRSPAQQRSDLPGTGPGEALRFYPTSYGALRRATGNPDMK